MKGLEFHTRPNGDVEVVEDGNMPYILDETYREMVSYLYDRIRDEYPQAMEALNQLYKGSLANRIYFDFLVVRSFIKCNWSTFDNHQDIDTNGQSQFEYCSCPLRGECKRWKIVCEPKRSTVLTPSEVNVLRCIASGMEADDIANELHISIFTVNNHRNNMLKKLDLHNIAALVDYWHKNDLK